MQSGDVTLLEVLSWSKDDPEPVEGELHATLQIGIQIVFTFAPLITRIASWGTGAQQPRQGATTVANGLGREAAANGNIKKMPTLCYILMQENWAGNAELPAGSSG
jgi:hypothetical protein